MPRAAIIQMCSCKDIKKNLQQAALLIEQAAQDGAQLIVLPENFALMVTDKDIKRHASEPFGQGPIQDFLQQQAKKKSVWIVGGTLPIATNDINYYHAATLVYDNHGQVVACYNKIHLFDAQLSTGEAHQESAMIQAGQSLVCVDTPVGKLGLAICYDIRFPELFRALVDQGAEIIAIPTAFTVPTGQAHWDILTRARAIENFCYVLAPCQWGRHQCGRNTYGHSVIIDPWGKKLAEQEACDGTVSADIDLQYLHTIRSSIPALTQRRIHVSFDCPRIIS